MRRRFFWKRDIPRPVAQLVYGDGPLLAEDHKKKLMDPIEITDDYITLKELIRRYPCPEVAE
jgi:hypothetical protein